MTREIFVSNDTERLGFIYIRLTCSQTADKMTTLHITWTGLYFVTLTTEHEYITSH